MIPMKIWPKYFLHIKKTVEVLVRMSPTRVTTRGNGGNLHRGALAVKVHSPH